MTLSPRQAAVLAYIQSHITETGRFPTPTEITEHMGWKYATGARDVLIALARKGVLTCVSRELHGRGYRRVYELGEAA